MLLSLGRLLLRPSLPANIVWKALQRVLIPTISQISTASIEISVAWQATGSKLLASKPKRRCWHFCHLMCARMNCQHNLLWHNVWFPREGLKVFQVVKTSQTVDQSLKLDPNFVVLFISIISLLYLLVYNITSCNKCYSWSLQTWRNFVPGDV